MFLLGLMINDRLIFWKLEVFTLTYRYAVTVFVTRRRRD